MFSKEITFGEKYGPAMDITTQEEADAYLEKCVQHTMLFGRTRKEAISIEKENIGFRAGYYSDEVRKRVEKLFKCSHPVFGNISETGPISPEYAFQTLLNMHSKRD